MKQIGVAFETERIQVRVMVSPVGQQKPPCYDIFEKVKLPKPWRGQTWMWRFRRCFMVKERALASAARMDRGLPPTDGSGQVIGFDVPEPAEDRQPSLFEA